MKAARDLNALIGSRICHDLISPLGAIGNGVELMTMTGAAQTPEMALISDSVDSANARIRFFRIAFGAAPEDAQVVRGEILSILGDMERLSRMRYRWQALDDPSRQHVKLVFLLLQCFETAMPRGGRVSVEAEAGRWRIFGEAEVLSIDPALFSLLIEPEAEADIRAAQVQFPLAGAAARGIGRPLAMEIGETALEACF
ncbi:MAG: histidine phosphotransferase family protein [Pseudomonadota bacterium]